MKTTSNNPGNTSTKTTFLILFIILVLAGTIIYFYSASKDKQDFRVIEEKEEERPEIGQPETIPEKKTSPSEILDLDRWKLTVPVANPSDDSVLLDVRQPDLDEYQIDPWFMPTADGEGVIFRAAVSAPTTKNSEYPRTELREMGKDGRTEAFWSSTNGTHSLYLDQAITSVPKNKKHVVAGQIHGDDDDLLVIRLEYPKLYLTRGGKNLVTLDENYALGKRFSIRFEASDGKMRVYFNDSSKPVHVLEKKVKEAYFKAGVYTQSNCETEGSRDLCSDENFGETVIYKLEISHN